MSISGEGGASRRLACWPRTSSPHPIPPPGASLDGDAGAALEAGATITLGTELEVR